MSLSDLRSYEILGNFEEDFFRAELERFRALENRSACSNQFRGEQELLKTCLFVS